MQALLGRISLARKFLLVGVLSLVLFGIPTYLFVSGIDSSIGATKTVPVFPRATRVMP